MTAAAETRQTYKGCLITTFRGGEGFVWEEIHYGAECDEVFPTVAAAKANIDLFFGNGPAPVERNGELYA